MILRVTTLIAVAAAAAAIGSTAPHAYADTPDQQFLNLVHSNGVGGQDDTLVAFAHQFCDSVYMSSGWDLVGQGVSPGQIYVVKVAASRVYCPDKIAAPPPGPPNVYHGGNL